MKTIGKRVGFDDDRPVWEAVLNFINAELRRDRDKMSELFKGDLEFIGEFQRTCTQSIWRGVVAWLTWSEPTPRKRQSRFSMQPRA